MSANVVELLTAIGGRGAPQSMSMLNNLIQGHFRPGSGPFVPRICQELYLAGVLLSDPTKKASPFGWDRTRAKAIVKAGNAARIPTGHVSTSNAQQDRAYIESVEVRLVSAEESRLDLGVEWLLETEGETSLFGFRCVQVESTPGQVQVELAGASRCLIIYLDVLDRSWNAEVDLQSRAQRHLSLRSLLSSPIMLKAAAKIHIHALDLLRFTGITLSGGINITSSKVAVKKSDDPRRQIALPVLQNALDARGIKVKPKVRCDLEQIECAVVRQAVEWRQQIELRKASLQGRNMSVEFDPQTLRIESGKGNLKGKLLIIFRMNNFSSRIRKRSSVWVRFRNQSLSEVNVEVIEGFEAKLSFPDKVLSSYSFPITPSEIVAIELSRQTERDSMEFELYELLGRICAAAPADKWHNGQQIAHVLTGSARIPKFIQQTHAIPKQLLMWLNASQQTAVSNSLNNVVSICQGPPGTGKTRTIAVLVASILAAFRKQFVICTAQTNTAARHIAEQVSKLVSPDEVCLKVSDEFYQDWHEHEYTELLRLGYKKDRPIESTSVLICTLATLMSPTLRGFVCKAGTLILDEASQVWDVQGILILDCMSSLKRVCLFGDHLQLSPYDPKEMFLRDSQHGPVASVCSILDIARSSRLPLNSVMLDVSYRLPRFLCVLISRLFYDDLLRWCGRVSPQMPSILWHDVMCPQVRITNGSSSNSRQTDQIVQLYGQELSRGTQDIAIICFFDAQRKEIAARLPQAARVKNVDGFQGQEAEVILLCLSKTSSGGFLEDHQRVNVACSRAKGRLHIVSHPGVSARGGIWQQIRSFALRNASKPDDCHSDDIDWQSGATGSNSVPIRQTPDCGWKFSMEKDSIPVMSQTSGGHLIHPTRLQKRHSAGSPALSQVGADPVLFEGKGTLSYTARPQAYTGTMESVSSAAEEIRNCNDNTLPLVENRSKLHQESATPSYSQHMPIHSQWLSLSTDRLGDGSPSTSFMNESPSSASSPVHSRSQDCGNSYWNSIYATPEVDLIASAYGVVHESSSDIKANTLSNATESELFYTGLAEAGSETETYRSAPGTVLSELNSQQAMECLINNSFWSINNPDDYSDVEDIYIEPVASHACAPKSALDPRQNDPSSVQVSFNRLTGQRSCIRVAVRDGYRRVILDQDSRGC